MSWLDSLRPWFPILGPAVPTALAGVGFLITWVRRLNRLRGDVQRLQKGFLTQNRRVRLAADTVRRLTRQLERYRDGIDLDPAELRSIHAKADDLRDELWSEEGNLPRRRRPSEALKRLTTGGP